MTQVTCQTPGSVKAKDDPARRRLWYETYKASPKGAARDMRVKLKKYGLTACQLTQLRISQDDACALCRERLTTPYVDHCHTTGRVRGLLCLKCNSGIGFLRDDPAVARRAATYLEDPC